MSKTKYYEQIGVAMTCRSFEEYVKMFMLNDQLLKKGRVLDVASGASSFVAELSKRGYDAVAVDPTYRLSLNEMESFGWKEIEKATENLDKVKGNFIWESYGSLDIHNHIRKDSFLQFLESYKINDQHNRYIQASLPSLPFENESFSLVLCNHFLFLYQEQFDYLFHLQAINELLRISTKNAIIRIYPLVGFKNEAYPHLGKLIKSLEENNNVEIKLTSTDFRFIPTATHFLDITKR